MNDKPETLQGVTECFTAPDYTWLLTGEHMRTQERKEPVWIPGEPSCPGSWSRSFCPTLRTEMGLPPGQVPAPTWPGSPACTLEPKKDRSLLETTELEARALGSELLDHPRVLPRPPWLTGVIRGFYQCDRGSLC